MTPETTRLLVSVHDVMPETLDAVDDVLGALEAAGLAPTTLLVVPGRAWTPTGLSRLAAYAASGHELAGHGWSHAAARVRGPRHRLHSWLISRNAAEHLAVDSASIEALIARCRCWFDERGLGAPRLYVPPAWAMGAVARSRLASLGFRYYETLAGIYDSRRDALHRLPLLGFEADTAFRAAALRVTNTLNGRAAAVLGVCRLAIHPHDPRLRLGSDLQRLLEARFTPMALTDLGHDDRGQPRRQAFSLRKFPRPRNTRLR